MWLLEAFFAKVQIKLQRSQVEMSRMRGSVMNVSRIVLEFRMRKAQRSILALEPSSTRTRHAKRPRDHRSTAPCVPLPGRRRTSSTGTTSAMVLQLSSCVCQLAFVAFSRFEVCTLTSRSLMRAEQRANVDLLFLDCFRYSLFISRLHLLLAQLESIDLNNRT